MVGGSRGGFQPHNHTRAIILLMKLEKMLPHHGSRATAPATETTLEQDPYMLSPDVIIGSVRGHFNVSTEWADVLTLISQKFGRRWHTEVNGQA